MARFVLLAAAAIVVAFASLAHAAPVAYTAALSGPNENPANASPATGSTTVFYDAAAHTLRVVVTFTGLTAGTTASHIHCCVAAPGNAGVATTTPTFAGFPLGVTGGVYDNTLDLTLASSWNAAFITAQGGTPAGAEAALASALAAGTSYLNVHTSAFPGGEIRGFLVLATAGPAVSSDIPTLSEWAMIALIAALGVVGVVAARARKA
jgi:hypothetical protein